MDAWRQHILKPKISIQISWYYASAQMTIEVAHIFIDFWKYANLFFWFSLLFCEQIMYGFVPVSSVFIEGTSCCR